LADKDGNGKCWQREKIEELHHISKSTKHVEYGNVVADKKGDYSDYYYFTPKVASKFTLIFSSTHPVSLQIGTSCKETSILNEKHDNTFVILDKNIEETIYIHVLAESEKSTSYEIHVTVTLNDDKAPQTNYNTQYGSHFDCQMINGNVTCKR
jgi:hypothetical protein